MPRLTREGCGGRLRLQLRLTSRCLLPPAGRGLSPQIGAPSCRLLLWQVLLQECACLVPRAQPLDQAVYGRPLACACRSPAGPSTPARESLAQACGCALLWEGVRARYSVTVQATLVATFLPLVPATNAGVYHCVPVNIFYVIDTVHDVL